MTQLTVRNIPSEVDTKLRSLAEQSGLGRKIGTGADYSESFPNLSLGGTLSRSAKENPLPSLFPAVPRKLVQRRLTLPIAALSTANEREKR